MVTTLQTGPFYITIMCTFSDRKKGDSFDEKKTISAATFHDMIPCSSGVVKIFGKKYSVPGLAVIVIVSSKWRRWRWRQILWRPVDWLPVAGASPG